jgi:hypothetical protein
MSLDKLHYWYVNFTACLSIYETLSRCPIDCLYTLPLPHVVVINVLCVAINILNCHEFTTSGKWQLHICINGTLSRLYLLMSLTQFPLFWIPLLLSCPRRHLYSCSWMKDKLQIWHRLIYIWLCNSICSHTHMYILEPKWTIIPCHMTVQATTAGNKLTTLGHLGSTSEMPHAYSHTYSHEATASWCIYTPGLGVSQYS